MKRTSVLLLLPALALSLTCGQAFADNRLKLLPTPKVLKIDGGAMPLTPESRIVATDPKLKPLADILADEILLITRHRPAVAAGEVKAGDIVLTINPALRADADIWTVHGQDVVQVRDYAHTVTVTDRVAIEGWDYRAVCEGTATLLQAIVLEGEKVSVPKMTVKDWPYSDYGAIMIDCAREHQPLAVLKTAAQTCRMFKIRYLHLHLSDDSAFTFPSTAYPLASSIHYPPTIP
ncbi:MAG: family 20 glycosylhydrolase, partial [Planctomycetota bacterium]|nr:family 20 glycosylhydrolase [Planctomycetota bacterium]